MIERLEIRSFDAEIRANENDEMIIEGYALKFNSFSQSFGNWREVIAPEALNNCDLSDVRCLFDHDTSKVLGRNTAKTLEIKVDDVGLYFKCYLPNTSYAKDLYESIQRGDINQMSFGFFVAENGEKWSKDSNGGYVRTLTAIKKIYEISIVSVPAYEDTNVEVAKRSLENVQKGFEREKELLLLQLELEKYDM
ncbi:UNVERIFIED_ORG: HK97 family phage prohead protease [Heyndrickxia coagulans]